MKKYKEKKIIFVIDIDDYEGTHVKEFGEAIFNCLKKDARFKLNVFAIPGMMTAEQIVNMLSTQGLIPCLHGFFHTQGECLGWTKDMALQALLWAEKANFNKVFRAPYWAISDGTYEALAERRWIVADHPKNKERLFKLNLIKIGYYHNYDLGQVAKMTEKEMWDVFISPVKIHGGVTQLESLVKFSETLSNINVIDPIFTSIRTYVRKPPIVR